MQLAKKYNSAGVQIVQYQIRPHLINCFNEGRMSLFPSRKLNWEIKVQLCKHLYIVRITMLYSCTMFYSKMSVISAAHLLKLSC